MMPATRLVACALAFACALAACASASINKAEPVRVTHKNSGPKYELDAGAREHAPAAADEAAVASSAGAPSEQHMMPPLPFLMMRALASPRESADEPRPDAAAAEPADSALPVGKLSIRRLILVPIGESAARDDDEPAGEPVRALPMWPPFPASRLGWFGNADSAARAPERERTEASAPERATAAAGHELAADERDPIQDPAQFMMSLLHHMLASHASALPSMTAERFNDDDAAPTMHTAASGEREKPASANDDADDKDNNTDSSLSPAAPAPKPKTTNETSSEIVEIDGQKFLRKTIVQKHVGPGVMFMTRRLIFTPLNETDSTGASDAGVPASTRAPASSASSPRALGEPTSTTTSATTTTTTTTSTTTAAPATSSAPAAPALSAIEKEGEPMSSESPKPAAFDDKLVASSTTESPATPAQSTGKPQ